MNVFSVNNPGSCECHFGISKRKAGKFKPEWDSNPFLCDADVVLCQLSDIALTSYKKSLDHIQKWRLIILVYLMLIILTSLVRMHKIQKNFALKWGYWGWLTQRLPFMKTVYGNLFWGILIWNHGRNNSVQCTVFLYIVYYTT